MSEDLKKFIKALEDKKLLNDRLEAYIYGPQPLKFSTERLQDVFGTSRARFEYNICNLVINATLDRLTLTGFDLADEQDNETVDRAYNALRVQEESEKAHADAVGMSSGFIVLGDGELYRNDPRMCHIFYDSVSPRVKLFAGKRFELEEDGQAQVTLYYPDRLEHWRANTIMSNAGGYTLEETQPNPLGVVPVFEFSTYNEIAVILTMQDAINKLFADMMVSSDFTAFPTRYAIGALEPGELKNFPGMMQFFPGASEGEQDTAVGQFEASPPTPYLQAIENLVSAVAVITRTPRHYIMSAGAGLSGDALVTMEAPLVKKITRHQMMLENEWKSLAQAVLLQNGRQVSAEDITVTWKPAETVQPTAAAQTLQANVAAGIPLITALRRAGWGEDEIARLQADMEQARLESESIATLTLERLRGMDAARNDE